MPVQSGRVITDTTQGAFNKDSRKEIEQIKREIVKPREKPVTPGTMQGFTRATGGSAFWSSSGLSVYGWTFDTTADTSALDKPALEVSGSYFGPTEPGHYCTKLALQFTLASGTPAGVLMQQNPGGFANVSTYGEQWAMGLIDGRYRAAFWCGPFWLDGTLRPLGAAAIIPGAFTGGSLVVAKLDVWRVG